MVVFFGSIPHADLLKSVARRIVDRRVLHLIKMWLECPVEETDERGRKTRTTEARDKRRGIPGWNAPWKKPTNGAGRHGRRRLGIAGAASRRAHRSLPERKR